MLALVMCGATVAAWNINMIRMGGPIQTSSQQASDLVADILPPPAYILEAYLETTLLRQNPGEVKLRTERLTTLHRDFETRNSYWRESDLDKGVRAELTEGAYGPGQAFWTEAETRFLPAVRAGDKAAMDASYARLSSSYAEHRQHIDATVAAASTYQKALNADGASQVTMAIVVLGGLGIVVLVLFSGASILIMRKVVTPVGDLAGVTMQLADGATVAVPYCDREDELGGIARAVDHFRQVAVERAAADAEAAAEQHLVVEALVEGLATLARGDMTSEIRIAFPPAYQRAKENFQAATTNLRHMIQSVVENAESIRTGTDEIAAASEDLARRTESNAASLEETSAALVQIDGRLKSTTEGSVTTVKRADRAIETVSGGRNTAEEAVQAMARVSTCAKGIDSVIEGVDKIAFQTRVLAMNAAVEAGRAGDAGRGFAVVADLVSALAMRAEEEAKRARDQLTVTQAEILTAVSAVERVDTALADISGDVGAVHKLLEVISSDNQAQSLAVTEITAAIASMDRATQQNAAMVEETSAATRTLTSEVAALSAAAYKFKFERRAQSITPIHERRAATQRIASAQPTVAAKAAMRPALRAASSQAAAGDWEDF
jgi:methyl-accepting chemotaxis protein